MSICYLMCRGSCVWRRRCKGWGSAPGSFPAVSVMPDGNERVIAFDFGLRWIGAAVGQSMLATGSPLARLKARDGIPRWEEIDALLEEWKPDRLVVGLPLNMDGSESDMSLRAR